MNKSFKEHLSESAAEKKRDFRIKVAGDFSKDQESSLKTMLEKYTVSKFKKLKTTPVCEFPLDFPALKNCEVSIFEVVLDYPVTTFELTEYLSTTLKVNKQNLVVRKPGEPTEDYQTPVEKREGALLNDSEYKESPNANFEDYYGDKYNTGFVKELNDLLKLERKARGEIIPTEGEAKFSTESKGDQKSVFNKVSEDPRK